MISCGGKCCMNDIVREMGRFTTRDRDYSPNYSPKSPSLYIFVIVFIHYI